jgi:hypothetical protein
VRIHYAKTKSSSTFSTALLSFGQKVLTTQTKGHIDKIEIYEHKVPSFNQPNRNSQLHSYLKKLLTPKSAI